jgi:hypothetical protein
MTNETPAARPGIEPGTPRSKRGMISVSPSSQEQVRRQKAKVNALLISPFAYSLASVDLMGVEPITPILQGSVAANGMEAHSQSVTEVGVEPTGTRLSTSPLNQFAYPANNLLSTFYSLLSSSQQESGE